MGTRLPSTAQTPASRGKRRGRPRRHTTLRRSLSVLAVGALVAGLTGGSQTAYAAPDRTLQSVDVTLGSDGAITGIDSVLLLDGEDEGTEQSFEPSESSAELPVRVLTSWRLEDRAGTDLADIEGESGRVHIDVTVQNTTVRPERVDYDANGTSRSQVALVGAPLTVVASADIGSLARVVTSGEPGQATNGVLGRSESGSSQVQWAAMLAPPRLASTATFTLVQDTESFEVPDLDVSVQPGLVTDPSVQGLLQSAFSEDPASALRVERSTIGLLVEVNGVLGEATRALDDVRDGLTGTADTLGRRTISDLEASTRTVSASLLGVSETLATLESETGSTLDSTSAALQAQLDQTISTVKALLGDAGQGLPPTSGLDADGCTVEALPEATGNRSLSIYEQVLVVQAKLKALRTASRGCAKEITADLKAQVGTDRGSCTAGSQAVICVIEDARSSLDSQVESFQLVSQGIRGTYVAPVARLQRSIGRVNDSMSGVVSAVRDLTQGEDTSFVALRRVIDDVDGALRDVQVDLAAVDLEDFASIVEVLDTVRATAAEQVALSDAALTEAGAGLTDEVVGLLGSLCALPDSLAGLPPSIVDFLDLALDQCGQVSDVTERLVASVETLRARLSASRDAWSGVRDQALLPDGFGGVAAVRSALEASSAEIETVLGDLSRLRADLDPASGSLGSDLAAVTTRLLGVLDLDTLQTDPDPVTCQLPYSGGGPEPTLNAVNRQAAELACTADNIGEDLDDFNAEVGVASDETDGLLEAGSDGALEARERAEDSVQRMVSELGDGAVEAGSDLRDDARSTTREGRQALDQGQQSFEQDLESDVEGVKQAVAGVVSTATRDLSSAEEQLLADLRAVLLDLGDPDAGDTGILGSLRTNADQTASSARRVLYANDQAADFAGVRSTALDDIYLQREQLMRSLQREQELPAFGVEVPGGTTVLTVYSFHLGGS